METIPFSSEPFGFVTASVFATVIWTRPQTKTFEIYSLLHLKYGQCQKLPSQKIGILVYLFILIKWNYKDWKCLWPGHTHNGINKFQDIFPDVSSYTQQYYLLLSIEWAI